MIDVTHNELAIVWGQPSNAGQEVEGEDVVMPVEITTSKLNWFVWNGWRRIQMGAVFSQFSGE